ncbi:MazG nucleotide pyrophosphohydrolase domain-containing protein [Erysipelothrix urinaevulpis]|uniref:MazG nucleotide pyrophosphohydrolase domain-containing protein n=1 Tax=Erysipelothrix urinaevulpis TaxID=2683717 RepID=UPI001356D021|nr:MazG nucleotide pyrophosphohydrolase domain-containing protein [Erysipelothrix urinaevulpis]
MKPLTITEYQLYLKERYKNPNTTHANFMKLVEEVGEVAEAINMQEGWKKDDGESSLAKELADVIHYAIAIAAVNDIDLEEVIFSKDKVASVKYNHSINLEEFVKNR